MPEADAKPKIAAPIRKILPSQPAEKRLAFWTRAFSGLGDISLPAGFDPAQFEFYGHTWQLPHAFVQVNGASAMALSRLQQVIDERPIQQMALQLFVKGGATGVYDGRALPHAVGDIVIVDYAMPYEIHTPGYEGIGLTFDKAIAPPGLQANAHGLMLAADSSAGAMLGAQMRLLVDHIDGLSVAQAQSSVDGILRFAGTAFPDPATTALRDHASLFERASWIARQRLSDADFGPEALADALNVSRSKLFRAFAPHEGVQRWLLATRLRSSLHSIVGWTGPLKISEIAGKNGFRSEAHFSRAFSKRYQASPSAVRALANQSQTSLPYLIWVEQNQGTEPTTIEAWLDSVLGEPGLP